MSCGVGISVVSVRERWCLYPTRVVVTFSWCRLRFEIQIVGTVSVISLVSEVPFVSEVSFIFGIIGIFGSIGGHEGLFRFVDGHEGLVSNFR